MTVEDPSNSGAAPPQTPTEGTPPPHDQSLHTWQQRRSRKGALVMYRPPGFDDSRPAVVTAARGEIVNLSVFADIDDPPTNAQVGSVKYDRQGEPNTWHWPEDEPSND